MDRAVFLDRDGVINRPVFRDGRFRAPASADEFVILPGVAEAIARLHAAGFRLIVVTNQPDVAKGSVSRQAVETIHQRLRLQFPLDDIKACFHADEDRCGCRKPKPGLLLAAAREWRVDPVRSFMVGDRWRDILAGRQAGCRTILVEDGEVEARRLHPDFVVTSLFDAVRVILRARARPHP